MYEDLTLTFEKLFMQCIGPAPAGINKYSFLFLNTVDVLEDAYAGKDISPRQKETLYRTVEVIDYLLVGRMLSAAEHRNGPEKKKSMVQKMKFLAMHDVRSNYVWFLPFYDNYFYRNLPEIMKVQPMSEEHSAHLTEMGDYAYREGLAIYKNLIRSAIDGEDMGSFKDDFKGCRAFLMELHRINETKLFYAANRSRF
jgi:hypothetical protein